MPYFFKFFAIPQPPLMGYHFFFGLIISQNPPLWDIYIYTLFWTYYIPQPPFVGYFLFYFLIFSVFCLCLKKNVKYHFSSTINTYLHFSTSHTILHLNYELIYNLLYYSYYHFDNVILCCNKN